MLHTIQANDVIPILPPTVGWVAAATLVYSHVPQGFLACCLCFMLSGTIVWLIGFHILVLIMLCSLVTSICGVFISGSYEPSVLSDTGINISEVLCSSRRQL